MLRQGLLHPDTEPSARLDPVELFFLCAADRGNAAAWTDFLRRYAGKIRRFIRGTLWRTVGASPDPDNSTGPDGIQESDLLQDTILRLVENDCAAMKRFSGTAEDELLAYLAVISRSVVMDALRRHRVFERPAQSGETQRRGTPEVSPRANDAEDGSKLEREILGRELTSLSQRAIKSLSGSALSRDQLVFDLYFSDGLSLKQIAECKGINLTKDGVAKLLNRLVDRVKTIASTGKSEASCDEKR